MLCHVRLHIHVFVVRFLSLSPRGRRSLPLLPICVTIFISEITCALHLKNGLLFLLLLLLLTRPPPTCGRAFVVYVQLGRAGMYVQYTERQRGDTEPSIFPASYLCYSCREVWSQSSLLFRLIAEEHRGVLPDNSPPLYDSQVVQALSFWPTVHTLPGDPLVCKVLALLVCLPPVLVPIRNDRKCV